MTSCLVTAKVSSRAATEGAHQATITFLLVVRIGWAVALRARRALTIRLLALGVLLRGVGALLGELIVGSLARVLLLVLWLTVGTDKISRQCDVSKQDCVISVTYPCWLY